MRSMRGWSSEPSGHLRTLGGGLLNRGVHAAVGITGEAQGPCSASFICRGGPLMAPRSLHLWRLKFMGLTLLAAVLSGCAEDPSSRERSTRPEPPVTLVDPTDPNQASK